MANWRQRLAAVIDPITREMNRDQDPSPGDGASLAATVTLQWCDPMFWADRTDAGLSIGWVSADPLPDSALGSSGGRRRSLVQGPQFSRSRLPEHESEAAALLRGSRVQSGRRSRSRRTCPHIWELARRGPRGGQDGHSITGPCGWRRLQRGTPELKVGTMTHSLSRQRRSHATNRVISRPHCQLR
jgi:hypothetical protein